MGIGPAWSVSDPYSRALYVSETSWASGRPKPLPGQDYYILPTWQRMVGGVTTGLIAIGLGAALFYLRRLYLARTK
jgi:hypothetical protein